MQHDHRSKVYKLASGACTCLNSWNSWLVTGQAWRLAEQAGTLKTAHSYYWYLYKNTMLWREHSIYSPP